MTFAYDVRAKLAPVLLFTCGGLAIAWGDELYTPVSFLAFVLGTTLIVGFLAVELASSSAGRQRLPRTPGGHARLFLTPITALIAVDWLLNDFHFEADWRSLLGWFVAWTLMHTAMYWAALRTRPHTEISAS